MVKNIEELTLLLIYLTAWQEKSYCYNENGELVQKLFYSSWKGYSFDVLNKLTDNGYLYSNKNSSKSVTITPEGLKLIEELKRKYLNDEN